MAEFSKITEEVIDIATEIIDEYIPELQDASIGFLFRDKAPKKGNGVVLGQARRVGAEYAALGLDYDFIIWLAEDWYYNLDDGQRKALIHHELLHCEITYKDDEPVAKMRNHDFEEFNDIIKIYGFWRPRSEDLVEAVQAALPLMEIPQKQGRVEAVDPALVGGELWVTLRESRLFRKILY